MANTTVGKVTHYYQKIGVAVVELTASLSIGDEISFNGSTDFSQTITSMQVEHETISTAHKGDTVGLKVDQPVKPGDTLIKS